MPVTTNRIPLRDLGTRLDRLPAPGTAEATIELVAKDLGAQIQAYRMPWQGVIYDGRNEVLEIALGDRHRPGVVHLRHAVADPKVVWLNQRDGRAQTLAVEASGGTTTLIRFHYRQALTADPGPSAPLSGI